MSKKINERRKDLKKFHNIYYNNSEKYQHDIKHERLPEWMSSYGRYLEMEIENRLPKYYPVFKQGTVVMTNYGVGSEMSFSHFSVVLGSDDSKYKRNLIVIPLSSKHHKGYVSLGNELFSEATKLAFERISELSNKSDKLNERALNLKDELDMQKAFHFHEPEEIAILELYISDDISDDGYLNLTLDLANINTSPVIDLLHSLESTANVEQYPKIMSLINSLNDYLSKAFEIQEYLEEIQREIKLIKGLVEQLNKYNKNTFADVSSITTISKLRVKKFSRYNISGNITISRTSIEKLKKSLSDRI
ncbi:hypothetical protein D0499_05515 [Weissella soli]|uniref:type II toxin-antitoxin system PemK/MazF family toxin n=1 Tax=Weissella soli TaxID=155866 RepID=UPI0021BF6488|nr:type II toxin-antitoxin system PemK/MazF family toxin [Weissella soli]MCT8395268.1 hypothetical protein [Weissella soli]